MKNLILILLSALPFSLLYSQTPIIDMHLHALPADFAGPVRTAQCVSAENMITRNPPESYMTTWGRFQQHPQCESPVWAPETDDAIMNETIAALQENNIYAVASGPAEFVQKYAQLANGRIFSGLEFSIEEKGGNYSINEIRTLHSEGRLDVLGEITNQYAGILPDDKRMDEYWKLAEELDLPVAIHIGTGPPGAAYLGNDHYRAFMHSPLTMEEVFIKYPNLRVQIMHAGYPMLDDLLAVLYVHPQVYIDIAVINWLLPKPEFYRYLKSIVDAGYLKRIMYGSDQMIWPGVIERSIKIIQDAPFLNHEQKRDILYNNAARFLRLGNEEIKRHHAMQ